MKLEEFRKEAHDFTAKFSEINRNFAFAGVAIIWLFKIENIDGRFSMPEKLLWPLLFIIASLLFDLLQYLFSSIIWTRFHRMNENKGIDSRTDIKAPKWMSNIGYVLFYVKGSLNITGFIFLFCYTIKELF